MLFILPLSEVLVANDHVPRAEKDGDMNVVDNADQDSLYLDLFRCFSVSLSPKVK